MEFTEALETINHIIDGLDDGDYDGIIVKRLEASNTLDDERTTNQTHIAITGEQMNIFPYLMADGYFQCDYNHKDEQLKKYFITQIPLRIYKKNTDYLLDGQVNNELVYNQNKYMTVRASIVRGRRKAQPDQVQLSLTTVDDKGFIAFRKILHTGDFLVLLKHKEKLEYDCIGVRGSDTTEGKYHLADLNNKFFKLSTNTKVDIKNLIEIKDIQAENKDYSLQELADILKDMYSNADDKMQVASIHIFGIKYGKNITEHFYRVPEIIRAAGLNESYATELSKAINIYRCLYSNKYGIGIKQLGDESANGDMEINNLSERITGACNILLYGVPGAGKSHAIKTQYCLDEKYMERVVFHPDYTYSDFVGQILPKVIEDSLRYVFTPGPFTKMLKKAENDPAHMYYLVVEEVNRGNAPAIFGEIFQLLDRKEEGEYPSEEIGESEYGISNYDVALEVYGNTTHQVRIPSNMSILATMNTADQNIYTLDTAFQRRWDMHHIENNILAADHASEKIDGTKVSWGAFATVINEIVVDINVDIASSEDKRLGAYFVKKKELAADKFPEKVLKYLWDDAFKMEKDSVFKAEYKSLEDIIIAYESTVGDKLSTVLRLDVYNKMISKMKLPDRENNIVLEKD